MKKRLVSLALAALLLVAVPLSAFATSKFNTSVLSGRENVSISYFDEMTGNVIASLTGDAYNSSVTFDNGSSISVNADGYVFVNGKLRAIKSGDGRNLYHDLFVLFYPTAKE